MKINPLNGRLGKHRFHPVLVHFPSALYPFSFVMDLLLLFQEDVGFDLAGKYALTAAVIMSVIAMAYGTLDFLKIAVNDPAQKKAGVHALLNLCWFLTYTMLLLYRIKQVASAANIYYISVMGCATVGLFFSNYLGADLIIRHHIGIISKDKQ